MRILEEVAKLMCDREVRRVWVIEDDKMVGSITVGEILKIFPSFLPGEYGISLTTVQHRRHVAIAYGSES